MIHSIFEEYQLDLNIDQIIHYPLSDYLVMLHTVELSNNGKVKATKQTYNVVEQIVAPLQFVCTCNNCLLKKPKEIIVYYHFNMN